MTTIRLPDGVHLIVSTVLADILDAAGIAPGPDVVVGRIVDALVTAREKGKALDEERADLARRLKQAEDERDDAADSRDRWRAKVTECAAILDAGGEFGPGGLSQRLTAMTAELNALRACKVATTLEPSMRVLRSGSGPGWNVVDAGDKVIGRATSGSVALRLAEFLAGHDPGGRWTVAGHTVPVDVVRAVCGTVAVGWEAA